MMALPACGNDIVVGFILLEYPDQVDGIGQIAIGRDHPAFLLFAGDVDEESSFAGVPEKEGLDDAVFFNGCDKLGKGFGGDDLAGLRSIMGIW